MDIVDIVLAKALAGGGGGGGGSALPPITTTETVLFAEQSLTFSPNSGVYGSVITGFTPEEGKEYTVVWDGVTYTCTAFIYQSAVEIGNAHLLSSHATDTGEPFLVDYYQGTLTAFTNDSSAHTLKVSQQSQSPVDGTALSVQNGAWAASGIVLGPIVISEYGSLYSGDRQFTADTDHPGTYKSQFSLNPIVLVEGLRYSISWGDDDYLCQAVLYNGEAYVGNLGLIGGTASDEPFLIQQTTGKIVFYSPDNTSRHVEISKEIRTPTEGASPVAIGGQWVMTPIAVKVLGLFSSNVTIAAGAIGTVSLGNLPVLGYPYAVEKLTYTVNNEIVPLIVLSGEFGEGYTTSVKVYNPTGDSVSFTKNQSVQLRGVLAITKQ